MGYDFDIWVLRRSVEISYPADLSTFTENPFRSDLKKDALEHVIARFPGVQRNADIGWKWDVPEGGTLYLDLGSGGISVDCHASWEAVLEVFVHVLDSYPLAVLVDPQRTLFHDQRSFRDFLVAPQPIWPTPDDKDYSPMALEELFQRMVNGDRSASFQIWRLGGRASALVPGLIRLVATHPENTTRVDALHALELMGSDAAAAVPALIAIIETGAPLPLPNMAVKTLGRIGIADSEVTRVLLGIVQRGAVHESFVALKSLLQLKQDRMVLPVLLENLEHGDTSAPANWAAAFGDLFEQVNELEPAVNALRGLFENSEDERRLVAALALDALTRRYDIDPELVAQFLADPWERIRRIAVITLARLPRRPSVTALLEACRKDQDREVSMRAEWALDYGQLRRS